MPTRFDIAYYALTPALLPYLAYRRFSKGKYRDSTRGMLGQTLPGPHGRQVFSDGSVWIHAVSVGETVAAKSIAPLVGELAPALPLLVTTVTETGQAHARKVMTEAERVHYFPLDFSWNVRRFLDCFNPKIFIVMETEIWPNFLTECARRGTRVFMVNGKLSDKSFRGYRRIRSVLKPAFDAIDACCMQTESAAERMRELCGRPRDVHVTGNCKFDVAPPTLSPEAEQGIRSHYRLGPRRPTLVVGSTHPGEDGIILDAFQRIRQTMPDLMLILSPRHPERFSEVTELCRRHEASWRVSRATNPRNESPDVFVLDTMGELARVYGLGDVGVVAGSFTEKVGGHNLMEVAVHSIPVVVGPHMWAQKEIDRLFASDDSGCVRTTADTLAATLEELLLDDAMRRRIGEQARDTSVRNQGSARASIEVIKRYLADNTLTG
jgi:3-deoxy-D-manno-octulosonic-acid transferase